MSVQTFAGSVAPARPVSPPLTAQHLHLADRVAGWNIAVGVLALSIGALFGVFQGLEHAKVLDIYPWLQPVIKTYYQGLTLHGALNAVVWTTFFICGFFIFAFVRSLNRPYLYPKLNVIAFVVMLVGLLTAAVPMLMNNATVLYTFYPPMLADWAFYAGLTLLVIGSWIVGYSMYFTYYAWRKENPDRRAPFIALAATITMVLWQIATLGAPAKFSFSCCPTPWPRCWASQPPASTRCSTAPSSGGSAIRWSTSGCCPPISPGTPCCPPRPTAKCSANRWPALSSGSSCSSAPRSASTTSTPTLASRRSGSIST